MTNLEPKCGAKTRNNGEPCKRSPVPGSNRCRLHGGLTPRGSASPHFKTGRYSTALPKRMQERYEQARNDPNLLILSDEIALLDSRLSQLLGRVDQKSGAAWRLLVQEWKAFTKARQSKDVAAMSAALDEIGSLIERGNSDEVLWSQITNVVDLRRKTVESERRRHVEMQRMISIEEAMTLIQALLESVRCNVGDPRSLGAIQRDFVRLTNHELPEVIDVDEVT